jgi:methyltransferase (TIGR00027 family)
MKGEQRSKTAESVAAIRAAHLIYDDPIVFEDKFAIQLTSSAWRTICKSRILHWLVAKKILGVLRPIHGQVLARARYTEDELEKALADGVDQYVLVSAGLDAFALRRQDLTTKLKVYELDHPASQRAKRERIAHLNIEFPKNLEFISIDFEKESIVDALSKSSYSCERRAFFSWLGTTHYLTRDAIFRTLESIASSAAPGSDVVLDYSISRELIEPSYLDVYDKASRFVARRGEPLIENNFDPQTFPSEVCSLGFELIEQLSPKEQEARYFVGRKDDLINMGGFYFAHFCSKV